MTRDEALTVLKRHAPELRGLGVVSASLFGSTARDEATGRSDIDVAVKLDDQVRGLYAFGALDRVKARLAQIMQAEVDVVPEPNEPGPLKAAIDKDRCVAVPARSVAGKTTARRPCAALAGVDASGGRKFGRARPSRSWSTPVASAPEATPWPSSAAPRDTGCGGGSGLVNVNGAHRPHSVAASISDSSAG